MVRVNSQKKKKGRNLSATRIYRFFNLYCEATQKEVKFLLGSVGGLALNNVRYADVTVLMADTKRKMQ